MQCIYRLYVCKAIILFKSFCKKHVYSFVLLKHPVSHSLCWFTTKADSVLFSLSPLPRVHPYMWRHFKGEERNDREPRFSVRISQWSQLYLGDCSRGEEQDPYSFSIFRSGGGIWLFIFVRRAPAPRQLQDKVRTSSGAHPHFKQTF